MKRSVAIAALFVAAWLVVRSPALAQVPGGPGCCQRIGSCVVGSCYTSPDQSGGQFWAGLTCTNGKDCVAAGTFNPAEPQSTAVDVQTPKTGKSIFFIPNVGIPGTVFSRGSSVAVSGTTIGDFIVAFYVWFAGAAGMLAVFMVMFGGWQWLTAAGNAGRIGQAKETITGAVVGLVLLLGSYVLLASISPTFVNFKDLKEFLTPIKRLPLDLPERFGVGISEELDATVRQTLITRKDVYNRAGCPTLAEMKNGFSAFLTGYYRPDKDSDDAAGYGSVMCNIGMQCSCDRIGPETCTATGISVKWAPCDPAKLGPDYCTHTPSGQPPQDRLTAAASARCFGFGTKFTVIGGPAFTAPQEWTVNDWGKDIQGRHFDLYTGTGAEGKRQALQLRSEVTVVVKTYCPNVRGAKCGPP